MKRLCATVLIFEAIVIGLSIPVAVRIDHLDPHAAGLTLGIAAAAAVVFAGLAGRLMPATLVGGSLLQIFVIATGEIVPRSISRCSKFKTEALRKIKRQ